MNKPTKIFVAGLIAAAMVWTAGIINSNRLERREAHLGEVCLAQNAKQSAELAKHQNQSLVGLSADALQALAKQRGVNVFDLIPVEDEDQPVPPLSGVCDVEKLRDASNYLMSNYQTEIVIAHRAVQDSRAWPIPVALAVLCIGGAPWLWYFLLRRIAELRAAISGKPPI